MHIDPAHASLLYQSLHDPSARVMGFVCLAALVLPWPLAMHIRASNQATVTGRRIWCKPCAYPKLLMVTTHASTQQALQLGQSPPASKPCIHTGTTDSRRGIPHRCWRMLKCAKLVYGSIWVYLLLSRFITRSEHLSTSYRYCPFAGWCRQITHARSARLHLSLLAPFSIATFYQLPPN